MNVIINQQTIVVEIVPNDVALSALEQSTLEQIDQALRANSDFQKRYPNAHLERVDSMRALPDSEEGRFYLRYSSTNGMTEFWGHCADQARINFKRGTVSICAKANSAQMVQS